MNRLARRVARSYAPGRMATRASEQCKVTWRAGARSVTALAVAYALVFQLFAAAVGFQLASTAVPGAALELCAHASQDAPVLPGDVPSAPCIQHCVLCCVSN